MTVFQGIRKFFVGPSQKARTFGAEKLWLEILNEAEKNNLKEVTEIAQKKIKGLKIDSFENLKMKNKENIANAVYDADKNKIHLKPTSGKSTILHELVHACQYSFKGFFEKVGYWLSKTIIGRFVVDLFNRARVKAHNTYFEIADLLINAKSKNIDVEKFQEVFRKKSKKTLKYLKKLYNDEIQAYQLVAQHAKTFISKGELKTTTQRRKFYTQLNQMIRIEELTRQGKISQAKNLKKALPEKMEIEKLKANN